MSSDTIFREYRPTESERSDRSAGDRLRHRQKVRESIRENIADIIAEESIIGKNKDKVIKVPLRGIKEYRFVYGDNTPGVDYYETDVTLEELIEIMFEDLELPNLERRALREIPAERITKRKGYRHVGIRVRLDKRRTARQRVVRMLASQRGALSAAAAAKAKSGAPAPTAASGASAAANGSSHGADLDDHERRFPFHQDDLRYKHLEMDVREESNAVVICVMDTSGSMDTMKKYLARSFFFLLYQFICTKYRNVEIVFIAHHTEANEVTEEEFFHKGESGGTFISSGYVKALEIIQARYHPSLWNVYSFHCSDGDNFDSDNPAALRTARELAEVCNLFGYGEIKPLGSRYYESSMLNVFRRLDAPNFQAVLIERKEDIWPSFKAFLSKDRVKE